MVFNFLVRLRGEAGTDLFSLVTRERTQGSNMKLSQEKFSAYVPRTEAGHCKWAEVLKDLEKIKTSKDIDVSLYTANTDEDEECQEPVMRCFFLETEVIIQECRIKNCSETQDVVNIWKNGNASLGNKKLNSTTSAKCKECEEYEEKGFTEFIQNFVKVIQRDCKH
ncbi:Interleukin-15 [Pitangus sulphuratus]|nr:Interleukin-15 [Pitangus sulphuratus]